jgi:hypothetical protein
MLIEKGCVTFFDVARNRTLLPLFCDSQTLPTFEQFIDGVTAAAPDIDWTIQKSLVLVAKKHPRPGKPEHICHGVNLEDYSDVDELFLSVRDARADEADAPKPAASRPQQQARPAAPAEDDDDRWLREFFHAALTDRDGE